MQRLHWFKETINPVVCLTLQVRLDDQNCLFWCSCLKTYKYPDKLQLHLVERWSNKIRELLLLLLKAQKFAYSLLRQPLLTQRSIMQLLSLVCFFI